MWASAYGNGGYGGGGGSAVASLSGAGAASSHQGPPGALNGNAWWPDAAQQAYAGWYYSQSQAHNQAVAAAQGAAASQQDKVARVTPSSERPTRSDKVQLVVNKPLHPRSPPAAAKPAAKVPAGKEQVGISFFELEQRLNASWEDLEAKKDPPLPPTERALPMPSRLVGRMSTPPPPPLPPISRKSAMIEPERAVATSSIFCPLCAEPAGTCPFHAGRGFRTSSPDETSACSQHMCEAPPENHIAHAMVSFLDFEDASTEDCGSEGLAGSDDWSDVSGTHVSAALLQEGVGGAWCSSHHDSMSEDMESPVHAGRGTLGVPSPVSSTPSLSALSPVASPASSTPPSRSMNATQINRDHLNQILAMGFSEADARAALAHSGQRGVDAAITFLLDGVSA